MKRYLLPLALFLALISTLALGLKRPDPQDIPSPLVGKPVPSFTLTQLNDDKKWVKPTDFKGKVWLLNVWASWCTSCRKEHQVLVDLAAKKLVPIVGFNYQDQRAAGVDWLKQHGDPYLVTIFDADGQVGMDLGIIGVPETFVIDQRGVIRFKYAGPLTADVVNNKLLPLVRGLQRG